MISVRLDARLAARIDPSDVVQETLIQAAADLPRYLKEQPLPFYPWLRQIAWQRLQHLHAHHISAKKRSVKREEQPQLMLSDRSVSRLASRFVASGTTPSRRLVREELRRKVREALAALDERDREVLILRYLEGLGLQEVAHVLGVSAGAVSMRQMRALERLRDRLEDEQENER